MFAIKEMTKDLGYFILNIKKIRRLSIIVTDASIII